MPGQAITWDEIPALKAVLDSQQKGEGSGNYVSHAGWDLTPERIRAAFLAAEAGLEGYRATAGDAQEQLDKQNGAAAYRTGIALLDLRAHVERYARKVQRLAPHTFALEVLGDTPLIALLSQLYGGEASRIMNDVVRANSIIAPVRVRAGTVLQLPMRD